VHIRPATVIVRNHTRQNVRIVLGAIFTLNALVNVLLQFSGENNECILCNYMALLCVSFQQWDLSLFAFENVVSYHAMH